MLTHEKGRMALEIMQILKCCSGNRSRHLEVIDFLGKRCLAKKLHRKCILWTSDQVDAVGTNRNKSENRRARTKNENKKRRHRCDWRTSRARFPISGLCCASQEEQLSEYEKKKQS